MVKSVLRLILSGLFLFLTAILTLVGRFAPELIRKVYMPLSRAAMTFLSGIFSVLPVAVWELLVVALLIWLLCSLVRNFSDLKITQWFTGLLLGVSVTVFLFMALWGLNYYAPSIQVQLGLSERECSVEELKQATVYYRNMANLTANSVTREDSGAMAPVSFEQLAHKAADGYMILEIRTESFRGSKSAPKRLISGNLFAFGGSQGIFVPFTGESCVSGSTYSAVLPFAMCSQMGKRMGFARRDEAEFAAFLACASGESAQFVYSGYFIAFSYCYNALYARDRAVAESVWQGVGAELKADCLGRIEYESGRENQATKDKWETLGEQYQKFLQEKLGTKTADSVTNLLTIWYLEGAI
ncbi:MAG: DUF3810 family protein [Oscillospiraceae bacterium]|nr:DUF3810 family protein [Oscillospiraceae bacterium]